MPSQRLVDEGVVGRKEFRDGAILPQHMLKERLGLSAESSSQGRIEAGKEFFIWGNDVEGAQLHPLSGEVIDQGP